MRLFASAGARKVPALECNLMVTGYPIGGS